MKKILVILGPNLNMVGVREKGIYGEETASDIEKQIISYAESNGFSAEVFQSNHEGDLIDKIHSAKGNFDGVVINAGAHTLQLCFKRCHCLCKDSFCRGSYV